MTLPVTNTSVRNWLGVDTNTAQYADATIDDNITAAIDVLEHACGRYFKDRTFSTVPWFATTMGRLTVPIPGFRSFSAIIYGGVTLDATVGPNQSVWAIPDAAQSGVYVNLQFRAPRVEPGQAWWLSDPNWFDKAMDSPFYPANYGGGYVFTSMPNDLTIAGSAGYADNAWPGSLISAVKFLSAFYTQRPASILADVAITAAGGVLNYSQMPPEVRDFIAQWRVGASVVQVG